MPQNYADPDDAPWTLLARHLAVETTADEQAELRQWLRADPQHLQILTTVTRAWERAGEGVPAPIFFTPHDVEVAWQRFRPLMQADAPAKPAPPSPPAATPPVVRPLWPTASWLPAMRIAAGVALVFGAAYLLGHHFFSANDAQVAHYATEAQRQFVRLPDGSGVWLNARSQLHYASSSPRQPREVQLTGEAYFEVKPMAGQPFVVRTTTAQVRVVGTAFNVRAYAAEDSVEVSVTHGRVWLRRLVAADSVLLTARTRAALYAADAPGLTPPALRATPVLDANFRAWQSDTLRFVDAPLSRVAQVLRATFGTRLTLGGKGLQACRFTGTFAHPEPAQVLAVVQVATGATLRTTSAGQYTLSGSGCAAPSPAAGSSANK
ncbi:FecR family protein [Hymenobacter terrenus]|uniref:FecR family protein n=1 Tax=Hymenobacter terrenus TaxID=1629124 RepID=UPI000697F52C|nr:FecR domain-containing protein [Hymenobacter terrenus]